MPTVNLTQQFVDKSTCPLDKEHISYFDTKITGLVLVVMKSSRKTFYIRYTTGRGKSVQKKIANSLFVKLEDARDMARKYLGQIAMGEDPFAEEKCLRDIPTIEDFINNNYLPYVKTYKRSWETDDCLIRNHILPNFGKLYLDQFTKHHMISFIGKHLETHKPGSVNRVIILMRYIFNCAIRWEMPGITKNPTAGIKLLEENNKMERYLSALEANSLIVALKDSENQMLQYIIPMLILTGARKREVLDSKWEDFNFDTRSWRIPTSKSGKARHVPMSDGVMCLLANVPRHQCCDYVFANPKTLLPYRSIFCAWNTARKSVGLSDVRIHDLRHSFASFLINNGRSLYEVQKILGHTQISTTQRYAHLSQESLISAANTISQALPVLTHQVPLIEV